MLSGREVADHLGVDPKTAARWIRTGRIEAAQPFGRGGMYRVRESEVRRVWDELKGQEG
jgi:excisionase family DNA binding protein